MSLLAGRHLRGESRDRLNLNLRVWCDRSTVPAFGLASLLAWSGWRAAVRMHLLRAARYATMGDYPGLVLLGYLVAMEGFSVRASLGAILALCGVGLGLIWGATGQAKVAPALARAESATRTWRDPSPAFGIMGGAIVISILAWVAAAYVYRPFESTWPWVLPGLLLLGGTMFSVHELVIALSLRALQTRVARTVQVSVNDRGALVYRLNPVAYKVPRG